MKNRSQINFTKINIGCGYDKKDDYINVDINADCHPDILISNNDDSEILRNHYELVYARDVLEHIYREKTLETLLNWSDYLKIGGEVELQTSDIVGIIDLIKTDTSWNNHYGMTICMFGNQTIDGDFHYTGFTHKTLQVFMIAAGFEIIDMHTKDGWLLNCRAQKVQDWTNHNPEDDIVKFAFQSALGRLPEDFHYTIYKDYLAKDILKSIWSSPERLVKVARDLSL